MVTPSQHIIWKPLFLVSSLSLFLVQNRKLNYQATQSVIFKDNQILKPLKCCFVQVGYWMAAIQDMLQGLQCMAREYFLICAKFFLPSILVSFLSFPFEFPHLVSQQCNDFILCTMLADCCFLSLITDNLLDLFAYSHYLQL